MYTLAGFGGTLLQLEEVGTDSIENEKKRTAEMVAEALREAGTLILVFAPLYMLYEHSPVSWGMLELTLGVGALALLLGIAVERGRQ